MNDAEIEKLKRRKVEEISSILMRWSLMLLPILATTTYFSTDIGCMLSSDKMCGLGVLFLSLLGIAISSIILYSASIAYLVYRRNSTTHAHKVNSIIAILSLIAGTPIVVWFVGVLVYNYIR